MSKVLEDFKHALLIRRVASQHEAIEFPSEEAKREYLKEHPNANPGDHTVKKKDPRDYARERAQFAPPKKKQPFVGLPAMMASEKDSPEE